MAKIFVYNVNDLEDKELFKKEYNNAPVFRKEKIDRLSLENDKRLSLGAWIALERAMESAGVKGEVALSENGKPYLRDNELHFNLSHSGELAICAISENPVGVDIEKIREVDLKLTEKVFGKKEKMSLEDFFKMWTRKESFLKCLGEGFKSKKTKTDLSQDRVETENKVFFLETLLFGDYVISVCTRDKKEKHKIIKI